MVRRWQSSKRDIALRSYVDLDILMHKEDLLRAKEMLQSEGVQAGGVVEPKA
jgi:hypothetical protein